MTNKRMVGWGAGLCATLVCASAFGQDQSQASGSLSLSTSSGASASGDASGPAAPDDDKDYEPEDMMFESGVFAGILFPSSDHNLREDLGNVAVYEEYASVAPVFGARVAFYPIRFVGAEVEERLGTDQHRHRRLGDDLRRPVCMRSVSTASVASRPSFSSVPARSAPAARAWVTTPIRSSTSARVSNTRSLTRSGCSSTSAIPSPRRPTRTTATSRTSPRSRWASRSGARPVRSSRSSPQRRSTPTPTASPTIATSVRSRRASLRRLSRQGHRR